MWLFTRYGFYSIACAKQADGSIDRETIMIRARLADHLRNLQKRFPALSGEEVVALPNRDYRYRLIVSMEVWTETVAALAREQAWSNFKEEVARCNGRDDYERALHQIWSVMLGVQENQEAGK